MKEHERILSEKLITEFMGRIYPDDNPNANLYSSSWDWLMPVVEKIESNALNAYYNDDCLIDGIEDYYNINKVYKAVVEFIKWYNKQN